MQKDRTMTIQQKIEEGYILGGIRYSEQCNFYLMPIAYWILNYKKYDPHYNPKDWEFTFRDNLLIITDNDIRDFIKAIEVDKIDSSELTNVKILNIVFYIDFNIKLFVSSFSDIDVEEYLPQDDWEGIFDNPIKYLFPGCKTEWNKYEGEDVPK
ncbi:MAG: hypothetical protein ABWZ25_15155 [Chitinophagaceae bacterium]